jgi:thiol:disulfide interchange protein
MTASSGSPKRDVKKRLLALAGLVLIAGASVGGLSAVGLLGNRGGGEGISPVTLLDTPGRSEALAIGPEIGKLAPDFEVSAFDGTRHRLSDYRGKVVFVNLWATWCIFCRSRCLTSTSWRNDTPTALP